jgi:hypothetical protein
MRLNYKGLAILVLGGSAFIARFFYVKLGYDPVEMVFAWLVGALGGAFCWELLTKDQMRKERENGIHETNGFENDR